MIISASRRTDIPAFFLDGFLEDLRNGFKDVVNPFNAKQVRRVSLIPRDVELIVFWTKDPRFLQSRLPDIDAFGIPWTVLQTLTPYGPEIEPGLRDKRDILESFRQLAGLIGTERIAWRYDPVIVSPELSLSYHREAFGRLAEALEGYTRRCIVSFVHPYRKIIGNLRRMRWKTPELNERDALLQDFAAEASVRKMRMTTCAVHGSAFAGACIESADTRKDMNQRTDCLCASSVDIGTYGTCRHGCVYCYASKCATIGI